MIHNIFSNQNRTKVEIMNTEKQKPKNKTSIHLQIKQHTAK